MNTFMGSLLLLVQTALFKVICSGSLSQGSGCERKSK